MKKLTIKNSESEGLAAGIFLLFLAFIFFVFPFFLSLDMMQWGYGLICIGLFIFIVGAVTFSMYIYRYLRLRAILNGENVIVHWQYPKEKILEKAKDELKENKNENKFKLGAVWFFFILFTVIFLVIGYSTGEGDSMGMFLGMMISIALFITLIAYIAPKLMYIQSSNSSPDAIIATNGLYYLGQLHTWNKPLAFIDKLKINEERSLLVFTIKYFTKLGWYKYETYSLNIPIPEGGMDKAKEVLKKLDF